ncbi:Alpha-soluble NSF attachment protein 2 [Auxenochlorella protothecoides]|uniref:Alpha-soluble NSF attachment protein 2 n=2 Tax=Auxenochlorella protothecoides TaxID=3075 RepID=A0A087SNX2_AUXPR|nr:Alpha-soluble NSF attachment protein 2 [Auxenochlorella protothecoides]KFM27426.1 Alpha-soluble NSF attachment protein 2 [Auxenochlorella protothecoides]RMZ54187.1 hypothetical protein APUTEX25_005343 [Auxenochlorella protothecoides]|eukprot:RMZ54187.1 hypothetical protein APUTEX25_005343 [Auxenochlorella protothecoides]
MASFQTQGREWLSKGEKKLKSLGWFGNKYEEAAECFEKAANQFKLAKSWAEAGDTLSKLAEIHIKLESPHDAASAWVDASKSYLKIDHKRGVQALQNAVSIYTDMGRLGMAARQLREIGEVLEREGEKEQAMTFLEQAADLFATENSNAEANKCNLKIAQTSAELEQYPRAIALYEGIARTSVENNLLKYSAKGYLLCAGICQLASNSLPGVRDAIQRYNDIDITFENSREEGLLTALADALEARDADAFTAAVQEFDSMTRLDAWKTAILVRVKRMITAPYADMQEDDLT